MLSWSFISQLKKIARVVIEIYLKLLLLKIEDEYPWTMGNHYSRVGRGT